MKATDEEIQEPTEEEERLRDALEKIRDLYQEKRSDVADICQAVLDGEEVDETAVERRFVFWEYDGKNFEYDTLTTLVSVERGESGEWDQLKCTYSD